MPTTFKACDLDCKDLPRIQPLLNLVWNAGDVTPWLRANHELGAQVGAGCESGGAVLVERPDGYVAGLLCYRVIAEPQGMTLDCPVVILPDTVRSHQALALLIDEAERRARSLDCRRLKLALTFLDDPIGQDKGPLGAIIRDSGLAYHSVIYAKDIADSKYRPESH